MGRRYCRGMYCTEGADYSGSARKTGIEEGRQEEIRLLRVGEWVKIRVEDKKELIEPLSK